MTSFRAGKGESEGCAFWVGVACVLSPHFLLLARFLPHHEMLCGEAPMAQNGPGVGGSQPTAQEKLRPESRQQPREQAWM